LIGFAVSRAHHSDVGGKTPGSMPSDSTEIYRKYNNLVGYLEEILNYSEKIVRKELKKCQRV